MSEEYQITIQGDPALPALIYLPGMHGDWTLVKNFRAAVAGRMRFVEVTYPRTLTWTIEDYATQLETALLKHGVLRGWLLAESWGSQPAWGLIGRGLDAASASARGHFETQGLFLAGGFVKHPFKRGLGLFKWIGAHTPANSYRLELKMQALYMQFRHLFMPDTLTDLAEFAARRTEPDRRAMRWRLELLDRFDPRPIARRTTAPVYFLDGFIDPLVPWYLVRRWLRRNCPGYRGGTTFWLADHNLLATAPVRAAEWILKRMPAN